MKRVTAFNEDLAHVLNDRFLEAKTRLEQDWKKGTTQKRFQVWIPKIARNLFRLIRYDFDMNYLKNFWGTFYMNFLVFQINISFVRNSSDNLEDNMLWDISRKSQIENFLSSNQFRAGIFKLNEKSEALCSKAHSDGNPELLSQQIIRNKKIRFDFISTKTFMLIWFHLVTIRHT